MTDTVEARQATGASTGLPAGLGPGQPAQWHAAAQPSRIGGAGPGRPPANHPAAADRNRRDRLEQPGFPPSAIRPLATGLAAIIRSWPGRPRRTALEMIAGSVSGATWKVLNSPQFRLYFFGSLASNLGTWLQNTAQVLLAYQLTHSALWVGVVTCAQFSGSLFLGPWAAVVADRIGGRRMLILTQLFSAVVAGCLAWLEFNGALTELTLMIGALLLGLAFTFALPVQMAMIPRLLPERDTEAGLAMNSVSYNAGRALAPVLSILVISTAGFWVVFALNAISFIVFAGFLCFSRPRRVRSATRPARARDGIRIAFQKPRIWLLLFMVAAVTLADDPVLVLGPTLAHRVLSTSSAWAGYFLAALGCGTILGSLRRTNVTTSEVSRKSKQAAVSLLALALCILVFVAGFSPEVSLLAAFLAGAAALMTGAATQALLVRQSPQGASSIMALWAIAWAGTKPLASLLDGWLASTHDVRVAGCVMIAPAVFLATVEIGLPRTLRTWLKRQRPGWLEA